MIKKSPRIPVLQIIFIGILPSFIKIFIYRIKGYKIGKNVKISFGSVIIGKNVIIKDFVKIDYFTIIRVKDVKIESYVTIGSFSFIDTIKIKIGEDTRIREQVYVGGLSTPHSKLIIGKRCIIMQNSFINPTQPIVIGNDTGIGGNSLLFTHGSWLSKLEGFPVNFAPITIGDNVWLPWRVFVMPGVNIGNRVVIGANSLINKNIPANSLAAGSPVRIIKQNYPNKLSNEKRKEVIKQIIDDFILFIESYNFSIKKISLANGGLFLEINKKNKSHNLAVVFNESDDFSFNTQSNLLILDCETATLGNNIYTANMIVNLKTKERKGYSDIGETFINFISRYGIRFRRK